MLDTLLSIDRFLFLSINQLPHVFLADTFASFLSGIGEWGLVWILFSILLFIREEKKIIFFSSLSGFWFFCIDGFRVYY